MQLIREYLANCTLGTLLLPTGALFYTIEPPWLNNKRAKSCIPEGTYALEPLSASASGKYRNVLKVANVEGRLGILMHAGNTVDDTTGCIIVGLKSGTLAGQPAVLQSRPAIAELWELQPTHLTILAGTSPPQELNGPQVTPHKGEQVQEANKGHSSSFLSRIFKGIFRW